MASQLRQHRLNMMDKAIEILSSLLGHSIASQFDNVLAFFCVGIDAILTATPVVQDKVVGASLAATSTIHNHVTATRCDPLAVVGISGIFSDLFLIPDVRSSLACASFPPSQHSDCHLSFFTTWA